MWEYNVFFFSTFVFVLVVWAFVKAYSLTTQCLTLQEYMWKEMMKRRESKIAFLKCEEFELLPFQNIPLEHW